jgi:hypothetical protein
MLKKCPGMSSRVVRNNKSDFSVGKWVFSLYWRYGDERGLQGSVNRQAQNESDD